MILAFPGYIRLYFSLDFHEKLKVGTQRSALMTKIKHGFVVPLLTYLFFAGVLYPAAIYGLSRAEKTESQPVQL